VHVKLAALQDRRFDRRDGAHHYKQRNIPGALWILEHQNKTPTGFSLRLMGFRPNAPPPRLCTRRLGQNDAVQLMAEKKNTCRLWIKIKKEV